MKRKPMCKTCDGRRRITVRSGPPTYGNDPHAAPVNRSFQQVDCPDCGHLTFIGIFNRDRSGLEKVKEIEIDLAQKRTDEFVKDLDSLLEGSSTMAAKPKQMVPTFDNVLVKRDEASGKSAGGILLPDQAKDKPKRGIVVAVGPGRWDKDGKWIDPPCKAGDVVFVRHWNGADIMVGGVLHEIFNAAEIIAVETDDKKSIEKAYGKGVA